MMRALRLTPVLLAPLLMAAGADPPKLAEFKGHNPVVVMFAPAADDQQLTNQSSQLASLTNQAAYQSLIVVGVAGQTVIGASDTAAALRQRFGVAPGAFRVVVVDKDGRVSFTQGSLAPASRLAQAIGASASPQQAAPSARAN
jgi:hypothetical protein